MALYKPCPECGANLDCDERCDCQESDQPAKRITNSDAKKSIFAMRIDGSNKLYSENKEA